MSRGGKFLKHPSKEYCKNIFYGGIYITHLVYLMTPTLKFRRSHLEAKTIVFNHWLMFRCFEGFAFSEYFWVLRCNLQAQERPIFSLLFALCWFHWQTKRVSVCLNVHRSPSFSVGALFPKNNVVTDSKVCIVLWVIRQFRRSKNNLSFCSYEITNETYFGKFEGISLKILLFAIFHRRRLSFWRAL